MEKKDRGHYLTVPEGRIPVDRSIYEAWWHYENKEDYFMRRLKEEQFFYDSDAKIASFRAAREDSYDRLLEAGEEFAADQSSVEDKAIATVLVEKLSEHLTSQEMKALYMRFALDWTEETVAERLGMERMQYRRMMAAVLTKSKKILEAGRK